MAELISTTVEIYMVNSTEPIPRDTEFIYNSRNLYGQFDHRKSQTLSAIYNSRNLHGQFDSFYKILFNPIYNSRNLYGQFDQIRHHARQGLIYNSRNLYGQFDNKYIKIPY